MIDKIGRGFLVLLLSAAVLLGAFLGVSRFLAERGGKSVELVMDLNDIKRMAAYEKKSLDSVLLEIKKLGITDIGLFEQTLPDANAAGELYYAKGTGIIRFKSLQGKVKPDRVYIYAPDSQVRKRVYNQLKLALGERPLKFLGKEILEVDELEEELRVLGLGISESQRKYLEGKGFLIVPRVWNDPRYHLGNIEGKIEALKAYGLVIFDGEEILGSPDAIPALAEALKKFKLKYGYIEIVKQDGDSQLKKLMGEEAVRVHSVPKDELIKLDKEEALDRFVRAARERGVRLIYLRPFLPPQIEAYPVAYNLKYFGELKTRLEAAGFQLGPVGRTDRLSLNQWEILVLGGGVVIGAVFLLDLFVTLPIWLLYLLCLLLIEGIFLGVTSGYGLLLQKGLAFAAATIFPSYAVIATFGRPIKKFGPGFLQGAFSILNVLAETAVGIFLMVGLLADFRFMSGVEVFPAVKAALILPVAVVLAYFILKTGEGDIRQRLTELLRTKVSLLAVGLGVVGLGALAVLVARSGNFSLPVPAVEKSFRNLLEILLFVRPRTKEFLIGYPALMLAAFFVLRGKPQWLWLLAAVGVIAPISVFNTFSHIHTPLMISLVRTFNGLVLGLIVGWVAWFIASRFVADSGEHS
ncbi:MAG: DUF5693 family protein [Candidatus Margulisiibacteriota bacterium]